MSVHVWNHEGTCAALDKTRGGDNRQSSKYDWNKTGLMGAIRQEMDKQNPKFYIQLKCTIHQQSLHGDTLKSDHVIRDVMSDVNFT
jgi:hypothetical protein